MNPGKDAIGKAEDTGNENFLIGHMNGPFRRRSGSTRGSDAGSTLPCSGRSRKIIPVYDLTFFFAAVYCEIETKEINSKSKTQTRNKMETT